MPSPDSLLALLALATLLLATAVAAAVEGDASSESTAACAAALQHFKLSVDELNAIDAQKPYSIPTTHRVAYHKTHKTGSTTVGNILFHHAARNNLVIFKSRGHAVSRTSVNPQTTPADMTYYHFANKGARNWREMRDWFNSTVPGGALLTIVREPVSHYLSNFYFFIAPTKRYSSLEQWVNDGRGSNGALADFKISSEKQLDEFLQLYAPEFKLILVTDRIMESLVIWAFEFNWPLTDMLHMNIHDSHDPNGLLRWDHRRVQPTPKVSEVPAQIVEKIKALTPLDKRLYDYAEARLNASMIKYGQLAVRAVEALEKAKKALEGFCHCGQLTAEQDAFCDWIAMDDGDYEKAVGSTGKAPLVHLPAVGL